MIGGIDSGQTPSVASQGFGGEIESSGELRMDFLNLLIAQLSNQDPLAPTDNEAMIQQLATFSELEQLERVNANLQTQMGYSQSLNNTMMMSVAGKRVTIVGNDVQVAGGEPTRSIVRVPEAGTIYPRIVDADGKTVKSLQAQAVDAGFNRIEWDGTDAKGDPVPDGDYSVEVSATDREGAFMQSVTFSSGVVDTVQFEDNFVYFEVNGRLYTPADVVEVGVAERDPVIVEVDGGSDGDGGGDTTDDGNGGSGNTGEDPLPPGVEDPVPFTFGARAARSPWEALLGIR